MKPRRLAPIAAGVLAAISVASLAQDAARDPLADGFAAPPVDARPLVFWQWVNGNVTQEGIRLDLEWMRRIGLAGALMFDVGFRTPPVPQYVEKRVGFGTPEWEQALSFTSTEAKRLGLLLGAQSSGGWSVSGGPSVAPEQAMKKLVWSETVLTPRSPTSTALPAPPAVSGPYQDLPIANPEHRQPLKAGDVAVVAFRLPEAEQHSHRPPALSQGGMAIPGATLLQDGKYADGIRFTPDARGEVVIDARLHFVPQAVTLGVVGSPTLPVTLIETSADGVKFESAATPSTDVQPTPVITLSLKPQRKHWRVRLTGVTQPIDITEIRFDAAARVNGAQAKAGFGVPRASEATAPLAPGLAVDPKQVIDLTSRMTPDGRLTWRPSKGRWMVLRFGWSLTGRRTVPATAESIGLEVDKLDTAAVKAFADTFYQQYERADLDIALTDSWEAGQQNWTPAMFEEFQRRRGYDLRPWMPVLTGRVVGSSTGSEQVLRDFRRTIADLVADHYSAFTEIAHRRGMTYYSQAAGTDQPTLVDGLQAKGRIDVPTGEFWYWPEGEQPAKAHVDDVREAASAARAHGKPLVAVESLTTRGEAAWAQGPPQWRRMMDRFFAEGANRVILHTSAHQPFTDRWPGITLRQFGQHFTRNETWAEDAGAWVDYLARTSWLLQQGQRIADLAVLQGFGEYGAPARPAGFDFDLINEELLQKLEWHDGVLRLPGGAAYRALVLPEKLDRLDARTRQRLRDLEERGAVLVEPREIGATNLSPDVRGLEADLHWVHRATDHADIYFLTNQAPRRFSSPVTFRVAGRHVEIWDAVTGERIAARYTAGDSTTEVSVELEPWNSAFFVFRGEPQSSPAPAAPKRVPMLSLNEGWNVQFMAPDGKPRDETRMAAGSWTRDSDPAIRYHSGSAVYSRSFQVPASRLTGGHGIELDLGEVGDLARVRVNGEDFGVWWSPPLRRDITAALRAGDNRLEITVTNYWANRLIGDEQPGAIPSTFTPIRPYQAESPLRPAGLLGPVRLISLIPEKNP